MDKKDPASSLAARAAVAAFALITLGFSLALFPGVAPAGPDRPDTAALLVRIRDEVLELPRYPGEDFHRGEFHLGYGDDDTNKTHAVGILVKEEKEGGPLRMTVVVSRLEPSPGDPRVFYAKEPRTLVCRFPEKGVEVLRSDHDERDLARLLADILKAVVDKKNLLKGRRPRPGPPTCP
jgi:hypothetical protein